MKKIKKAIIGICAGFITGLLSTGGGMIVLPAIVHVIKMDEKRARGTTIYSILPMVVTASLFYYKDKYMDISLGIKCAIGGIVGGFLGTKLLKKMPDRLLKLFFIIFLLYASFKFGGFLDRNWGRFLFPVFSNNNIK